LKVFSKNERKVLKNKSVLLGVTGGAAAYKTIEFTRRLTEKGASVTVVMTDAAKYFVTPLSLEIASKNKVYTDLFCNPMAHIDLPARSDIMVIAPATANIIAKFAHGISDDLLSTCLLSYHGKTIIAPSMNWRMYENPAMQNNLKTLLDRGVIRVGPEKGALACGEEGMGRMADVADIIGAIEFQFTEKDLLGERVLVTAGPTREYLDPVRFISNRSSGRMGYAIAKAALRRGAEVTLISGHTPLEKPCGVKYIYADTSLEMLDAVLNELPFSTVLIMSAAVSDFMPADKSGGKIGKSGGLHLPLKPTPDILSEVDKVEKKPFIIGFAAETGRNIGNAKKKLEEKHLDMIVFNDITEEGSGFDTVTNKVIIIDKKKETELPLLSKDEVADALLDRMTEIKA
jgi:phosphopantothenoylcysteine decarboxylase / phosphopantothenate---cysteine ligase